MKILQLIHVCIEREREGYLFRHERGQGEDAGPMKARQKPCTQRVSESN